MHRLLEVSPSVVAQRLCDLLLSFPSAAAGGVQWCVLARKYEERHGSSLDIKAIGHACPLAAATALLWDVLRIVDSEDSDNPIVAVEDAVALTPRPGALGSWPSLYKALCTIVVTHGSEELMEDSCQTHCLLFSQLKPLLEVHWHANFDETSIGYLSQDGAFVRLKKMKHLITDLIRWRNCRVEWRQSTGAALTPVDDVMLPQLELATSKKHNDLILRYVPSSATASILTDSPAKGAAEPSQVLTADEVSDKSSVGSNPENVPEPVEFHIAETPKKAELSPRTIELESLRAENAQLKRLLQQSADCTHCGANSHRVFKQETTPTRWADIYDDPFEPPPDMNTFHKLRLPGCSGSDMSPTCGSTQGGSDWSSPCLSSCGTPLSMKSGMAAQCFAIHSGYGTPQPLTPRPESEIHSGAMTPVIMSQAAPAAASVGQQVCALVPMWVSLVGDRCVIPGGIVEKFKAKFEPAGGSQLGLAQAGEALNADWDNCYVHS